MSEKSDRVAQAEQNLQYGLNILANPADLQPEEWMLLATLIGEADLVAPEEQRCQPMFRMSLLD